MRNQLQEMSLPLVIEYRWPKSKWNKLYLRVITGEEEYDLTPQFTIEYCGRYSHKAEVRFESDSYETSRGYLFDAFKTHPENYRLPVASEEESEQEMKTSSEVIEEARKLHPAKRRLDYTPVNDFETGWNAACDHIEEALGDGKSILNAEEFLQSKDVWHHPRIINRTQTRSHDVAELLAEFAALGDEWISVDDQLPCPNPNGADEWVSDPVLCTDGKPFIDQFSSFVEGRVPVEMDGWQSGRKPTHWKYIPFPKPPAK